nr:hypothetical protein [Tanacetum cinerariifolium]
MALPVKHQLKFNIHKDAKSLMEAIEKRFDGNKETKKRNKADLEDQSLDDLFNNLKIYEAEVTSSSSTSPNTQNITFVSSQNTNITNESVSTVTSVFAASTKVPIFALPNVDNLSDVVIYSFFAGQSNSPRLDNDDLKQIDADDLEEIDLKWQMAMLTMRARRFLQRTKRNLGANETTSIGFDMSKVECYNCHRRGHFARECSVGSYDWSFQADEEPTNDALMAFTSSSSSSFDNEVAPCSKECSKAYATLQTHYDKLTDDLRKKKFKKAEQERDELKLKLENFQTSSKNLSKLLASQITDKIGLGYDNQVFNSTVFDCDELISSESDVSMPTSPVHDRYKSGEAYHVVPPPYTGTFMPPKPDLVFHNDPTTCETVPTVLNVEPSTIKPNKDLSQSNRPSAPIIEEWVFDSKDESKGEPMPTQKAPSFVYTSKHVKTPRPSVKPDCDYYEKKMVQKPVRNNAMRGTHQHYARLTHHHPHRHVVPTAVLTRSRLVPLAAARPVTTTVSQTKVQHQRPTNHSVNKAHSPIRRPINLRPSPKNSNFYQKVTTFKANQGNPQRALKDKGVIDSGCSRHMTWNISYLSDFKEINGGYVTFDGNLKGGKITGKGKIRTSKLDFDDVYFVKELKFNLFSVSQMCDKKNSVLFTDTECVILSSDFKLPNENHTEAVNTACYVQNKVLVTKPHNKTPYELLLGKTPSIGFMRLFGCPVNILNTLDPLEKFDGKADEGFLVRYTVSSKAFRVFNSRTRIVQETLHIIFLENQPNVAGSGPTWLFDTDTLTQSMNYQPVNESEVHVSPSSSDKQKKHDDKAKREAKGKSPVDVSTGVRDLSDGFEEFSVNSTNRVNAASTPVTTVGPNSTNSTNSFNVVGPSNTAINDEEDVGVEADFSNLETHILVGPIPTTRVHKDHHVTQIISDLSLVPQTRSMARMVKEQEGKSASTPIDIKKPLLKDPDGEDVDVHIYRSMIGSLMYLTSSRPDIMFAVCTVVATSSTKAEYVAVASCCAQVLWIQNQLLDYGNEALAIPGKTATVDEKDRIEVSAVDLKLLLSGKLLMMNVDSPSKFLMYPRFLQLMINAQIADLSSHNTKYTSPVLTQKVFANMRRIGKGFFGVDTPLFDGMLMPQQAQDVEDVAEDKDDVNEVSAEPTLPSPTPATPPPPPLQEHITPPPSPTQKHIPLPPQAPTAQPSSPQQQQQPSQTAKISMTLLNTLLETCATLTKQVVNLEQDKIAQAIEITKLKKRVKRRMHPNRGEITELDTDEDVTLEDVDAEVTVDADVEGRFEESQEKVYHLDLEHAKKVLTMQDTNEAEPAEVEEASAPRRRRGVIIQDPEEATTASVIVQSEVKSKDKGKGILVEEPKPFKRQAQIKQDKAFARQLYGLAKVKSWKLFGSCRVHILTLTTTQMILLVEKKYPLKRFTLEQMLNNVRLEVEEESEMSLELLRLVRRQLQEGYKPE